MTKLASSETLHLRARVQVLEAQEAYYKATIKNQQEEMAGLHKKMQAYEFYFLMVLLSLVVFAGYFLWVMV